MASPPDRIIMLALAALYEIADDARHAPIVPSLRLRALLALVHAQSNGDIDPYAAFWRKCTNPGTGQPGDPYLRATYSRTEWTRIVRTLGLEPQGQRFMERIGALIDQQREALDPELATRMAAARAMRNSKFDREIVSTKGHPHSENGRRLMDERIARGEDPAGKHH